MVDAEAAAWLARLQDRRRPATEKALHAWLDADDAHAVAFERATELWNSLPGAVNIDALDAAPHPFFPIARMERRQALTMLCGGGIALVASGGSYWWLNALTSYETAVGQQQSIILKDGSRISLNTDSRVTVSFSQHERRVSLERGEAMFEVSKDTRRPFIVISDDKEVRALGTTFVVRNEPRRLGVTLLEGSVQVSRGPVGAPVPVAVLKPGERLRFSGETKAVIDHPAVETVTAWRLGEVIFGDVTLLDAATELNRYSNLRLVIADSSAAQLRVSGVFATRDLAEFARTVAELHGLDVYQKDEELRILSRAAK